jgi:ketosteroid isomerase-like protein
MYHTIVRRIAQKNFELLNAGDYESVLAGIGSEITHTFSGNHSLGGTRHSVDAMRRWFKRLFILLPQLHFTIHSITSSGWPWDTTIAIEWTDEAKPADGSFYINHGVHIIKMRWGKAYSIHAYLDTQLIIDLCNRLAAVGVVEATLPPIED